MKFSNKWKIRLKTHFLVFALFVIRSKLFHFVIMETNTIIIISQKILENFVSGTFVQNDNPRS